MLILFSDGSLFQNPRNRKALEVAEKCKLNSIVFCSAHKKYCDSDSSFVESLAHCENYVNLFYSNSAAWLVYSLLMRIYSIPTNLLPGFRALAYFAASLLAYLPSLWCLLFRPPSILWLSSPFALAFVRCFSLLIALKKHILVYDFQDILCDDTSTASLPKSCRLFLSNNEDWANNNARFVISTSPAMSRFLKTKSMNSSCKRLVIYNSFDSLPVPDSKPSLAELDSGCLNFVWFSQTVGLDRGLDVFFKATQLVSVPICLHVYGYLLPRYSRSFAESVPESSNLTVSMKGLIPHSDLVSRLPFYDCGLSLDSSSFVSRDLTLTNKTLLYLEAGLNVLCFPTSSHKELLDDFGHLMHIASSPYEMARLFEIMFLKERALSDAKAKNVADFSDSRYGWSAQEDCYLSIFSEAQSL